MTVPVRSAKQSFSRVQTWLAMSLLLLGVVALLSMTYPVEELSRRLGDMYFRLRPPLPTSDTVAMVLIDDLSLSRYGRWPWPRSLLARLVRATSVQRPAAIGFDVLLTEASNAKDDKDLAKAFREAGNVVLAAKLGSSPQRLWVDPLPIFLANSAGLGHVQAVEDADGICRSLPLQELSADGPRWALALQVSRVARGISLNQEFDDSGLGLDPEPLPRPTGQTEPTGWRVYPPTFLLIDYREQYSVSQRIPSFAVVSASDLLQGSSQPALRGKIVLIGFGATELSDRLPTPVSGQMPMPGVEVHANLVDGLHSGRTLQRVNLLSQFLFLMAFSLTSTGLILRWPGWRGVFLQLSFLALSYAAGYCLFAYSHLVLSFGPILCAGLLVIPLVQLENLLVLNRGLTRGFRQLRQALSSSQSLTELSSTEQIQSVPDSPADLAQRMDLINELQSELASHYTFRQRLLESMQEGLAVFSWDGKTQFRNRFWEVFCHKQGWSAEIDLAEFGVRLGHPNWANASELLCGEGLPPESEVHLGSGFWQVRAVRLAETSSAEPSQWMVVVSDLSSRLERDQARAEALRFVTHELRTPLVSIQGFAEFLQRYPQAKGASDAAATIFRESQRLVSLINTYLDVLRFDAGARSMRMEPVLIPQMILQLQQVMAPIADAAEIQIHVQLEDRLPPLVGDPTMLSGVFLNLLNNAVKYSDQGSLVVLRVTGTTTTVTFEVSNPGPPIPAEDFAHFFDPFYRAPSTGESTPGWGLGLTFVKRIVDQHRGTIEASSRSGTIQVRVNLPSAGVSFNPSVATLLGSPEVGPTNTPSVSQ